MTRRAVLACAGVALLIAGCADQASNGEAQAAIGDARVLWHQAGVTSYRYTIEWFCFCPPAYGVIEVTDGEIESVVSLIGDVVAPELELTIEDLFDEIEAAAKGAYPGAGGPGQVTVEFDPDYGYPVSASVDPILDADDDEFGWEITEFIALNGAALEDPSAPAGIHECALLTRGEVESVLGSGAPLGEFTTPAITISICTWHGASSSLVLTLFPTPDGGLHLPYPDVVALEGSEEIFVGESNGGVMVVLDADGTVVALEGEAGDSVRLAELLVTAAGRLP